MRKLNQPPDSLRITHSPPLALLITTNHQRIQGCCRKIMGHSKSEHPMYSKALASQLEAEACAKLCLERNPQRLGKSGRAEEVNRLAEIRLAGGVLELSSEVRCVEDIECLEEEADFVALVPLE